jgi:hypothetical protein
MSKRSTFFAIVICLLAIGACKKSNHSGSSGPNPLTGNWVFDGETSNANTVSTIQLGPISAKVINLIAFRTINNTGSLSFSGDTLNVIGVGYSIDTSYTTITSTAGTNDTTVAPLTATTAAVDTAYTYQLIGQDSIYFPNGSPFSFNVDSVQPAIQIKGAHFSISGTTLTFTSILNQSGNETVDGITAPTTASIKSVITLTKQ